MTSMPRLSACGERGSRSSMDRLMSLGVFGDSMCATRLANSSTSLLITQWCESLIHCRLIESATIQAAPIRARLIALPAHAMCSWG